MKSLYLKAKQYLKLKRVSRFPSLRVPTESGRGNLIGIASSLTLLAMTFVGVIYRLWIGKLVPQPFLFDQTEYHNYAILMLQKGLVAWQARLYGYPVLLELIYLIFGQANFTAVFAVQSIIDTLTGFLIFLTARKIFKKPSVSWICLILYLFNPFTSVFVILTLSEVWAVFLMGLLAYLLILILSSPPWKIHRPRWPSGLGMTTSLLLGYLPQVRPAFLFYSAIIFFWMIMPLAIEIAIGITTRTLHLLINFRKLSYDWYIMERAVISIVPVAALFLLPFTYNVIGNWIYFRQFSLTTVDNLFVREFYISLYVPGRSPFHANTPDVFPQEVQTIYNEYTPKPQNTQERKQMSEKYYYLGLLKVFSDPKNFVLSRLQKLWYVWEKHFLYYYVQPKSEVIDKLTYWGNNSLIFLAVVGFYFWFSKKASVKHRWFGIFAIFTVFYISFIHSFSLAEERYSLPGYPLIFLFAGFGIWYTISRFYTLLTRFCNFFVRKMLLNQSRRVYTDSKLR